MLRDFDFPTGHSFPRNHPKRQQLTRLIEQSAPEYVRAAKSEGFHSVEDGGRYIRCKSEIITTVINELMPADQGGQYMIKKNGEWVRNEDYNNNEKVRIMISERFKVQIEKWRGNTPTLVLPPMVETGKLAPTVDDSKQCSSTNNNEVCKSPGGETQQINQTKRNNDANGALEYDPSVEAPISDKPTSSGVRENDGSSLDADHTVQKGNGDADHTVQKGNGRATEIETNAIEALLQMRTHDGETPSEKQRKRQHHSGNYSDHIFSNDPFAKKLRLSTSQGCSVVPPEKI